MQIPEVHAAGVLLRRDQGQDPQWLLLRARKHGEWGFPKGHAEAGETPAQAALRECAEETGIGLLAIDGEPYEVTYRLPDGRTKRVFYFTATTEQEVVTLSKEHTAGEWLSTAAVLRRLSHPSVRLLFQAAARDIQASC